MHLDYSEGTDKIVSNKSVDHGGVWIKLEYEFKSVLKRTGITAKIESANNIHIRYPQAHLLVVKWKVIRIGHCS